MIPDWETNAVLISDLLYQRHPEMIRRLETHLSEHDVPLIVVQKTADIWIRDAAPIQFGLRDFLQFRYEPDYLEGREHLKTRPEIFERLPFVKRRRRSDLVIDGGNLVGTRSRVILTDKALKENSQKSRAHLKAELKQLLQIEDVILIPKEPYDVIGHSDGMVRFVNEEKVVVNDYSSIDRKYAAKLHSALTKCGLQIELLPYRIENKRIDGINSAVGNYVNYLRVGNLIVMPSYRTRADTKAADRLQDLIPDSKVISLDCRTLAREGGVLQCVTWTVRLKKQNRFDPQLPKLSCNLFFR